MIDRAKTQRIIHALVLLTKSRNFIELAYKLGLESGEIGRQYQGKVPFSSRLLLRAAIHLDMRLSELLEKLGLRKEELYRHLKRKYKRNEQKAA